MAITDAAGLPIGVSIASASPHEITLVEQSLESIQTEELPERLIGDKAYDSDVVDERIKENFNVALISPHKSNRKKSSTQDGRELRRYKKRWKIERFFSWLQSFRRVATRYEYKASNYAAMVKLATTIILMRYL
jgi:transposase